MATRTTRKEITLPPEIVALVFSFRPAEGHTGRREWVIKGCLHPWVYYDCCGGSDVVLRYNTQYVRGGSPTDANCPCTRFAYGTYHPGRPYEVTIAYAQYVRWSCCGAIFGYHDVDSPPGCTPLDLTLCVTTVTRAAPPTDPESGQAA